MAPGSWITLFGSDFTPESMVASTPQLPERLAGVEAMIGGLPLRLHYAGPHQINAIVPMNVPPNTIQQVLVVRNGVPSAPLAVVVAGAQPGVFTVNQQGTGQAAALHAGTATLAAPESPVRRGEAVEVYCAGLGPVALAVPDGEPAPLTPLARTVTPVSATVGGRPAEVLFAGLTPGTFGLYQVNVKIPDDAPAGEAVTVVLTQENRTSNPATIAIVD